MGAGPSSRLAGAPADTPNLAVGEPQLICVLFPDFLCTLECCDLNLFRQYEALDFPRL